MSDSKYGALRTISTIFKALAVIVAILAILFAVISLTQSSSFGFGGIGGAIIAIIYGAFIGLYFLALSEAILVFLDIEENTRLTEENTRQTNELLRSFLNRQP